MTVGESDCVEDDIMDAVRVLTYVFSWETAKVDDSEWNGLKRRGCTSDFSSSSDLYASAPLVLFRLR